MFSLLFSLFALSLQARAETVQLCNIELRANEKIDFSSTEEKWLCGDPQTHAWKSIPVSQQRLFLKGFLQAKGYHQPKMREENGRLYVDAGKALSVTGFEITGAPKEWEWWKRWNLEGKPLTPGTLDEASAWAKRAMQERGFPCPAVSPLAFVDTGRVRLDIDPGPALNFGPIESGGPPDLAPGILDRFTAFAPGQLFDIRLLELTSTRILDEDLYLSSYFDLVCGGDQKARIVRRFVPALPRLFTVGAGFDTDRGALARARLKWARLGPRANSLETSLFASFREQSLVSRFHYHFLSNESSRWELVPSLSVERLSEKRFITVTSQLGASLANSWELRGFQLRAEAGPVLERVNTIHGDGPKRVDNIKLNTKLSAMSHLFEYYLSDPRAGWMASLETSSLFGGVLSDQSIHKVSIQHQFLWNLGHWEPPFLILGWRGMVGSYFFHQRSAHPEDVAVNQKFFLGGDENIRGFARKELPGNGSGYFTALYEGFELRTGSWFPLNIQPFLFFDFAKAGASPRKLARANYYSPGFGIRYDSPIGTIRTSLGRGYAGNRDPQDPLPHWQFFFSFGREF
jgi:translocation and assembly module TamA